MFNKVVFIEFFKLIEKIPNRTKVIILKEDNLILVIQIISIWHTNLNSKIIMS